MNLPQSYFVKPQELIDLVDTSKLVQKYLPRQTDIDKILDIIKKGTHLLLTIKEIQAGYLTSLYFKDIYKYLAQNELLRKRHAVQKVETLSERFILLDSMLFKFQHLEKRRHFWPYQKYVWTKLSLCIMDLCLAGHQEVIKLI